MKKKSRSIFLSLSIVLATITFAAPSPSNAFQEVAIPYSYVGDGWDTVLIVSNISGSNISPYVVVWNDTAMACAHLGDLTVGDVYVNTFSAITGWSGTIPFPGVFQVFVGDFEIGDDVRPFGAAVAINNASFGGFGFQQYKSEYTGLDAMLKYIICPPL